MEACADSACAVRRTRPRKRLCIKQGAPHCDVAPGNERGPPSGAPSGRALCALAAHSCVACSRPAYERRNTGCKLDRESPLNA